MCKDEDLNTFEDDVAGVFIRLEELLLRKHADYGPTNISQAPGGALNGLVVRLWDKMARIRNLHSAFNEDQVKPNYESLEDTFKDMANYAIIALLVMEGKWPT